MGQLKLNLDKGNRGGRRAGSGRKRIHSKGVSHRSREKVNVRTPLHINFKYKTYIRNKQCLKLLKKAILNARSHGLRVIHFSMQTNHIHLIVEADTNKILTTGMRSLTVTFAKGLSKGRVQLERYHLHVLKTLREAKNAVQYVLFNKQKHEKGTCSNIDEFCSVFALKNVGNWLKEFAKSNRITLRVGSKSDWASDQPLSFLLSKL